MYLLTLATWIFLPPMELEIGGVIQVSVTMSFQPLPLWA